MRGKERMGRRKRRRERVKEQGGRKVGSEGKRWGDEEGVRGEGKENERCKARSWWGRRMGGKGKESGWRWEKGGEVGAASPSKFDFRKKGKVI